MDRRVKERLLGASILVMLVVLIVPELLSGPAPPVPAPAKVPSGTPQPVRNITVDLATNKTSAAEPAADAASATTQPAETRGATGASTAGGSDAGNAVANVEPSTSVSAPNPARAALSARLETAAPGPTSATVATPATSASAAAKPAAGAWSVQLGSFANRANADRLMRQLKAQGFAAYVVSSGSGRSLRYRVRVGPMADRGAATRGVAKLKSLGHASTIVPPAT